MNLGEEESLRFFASLGWHIRHDTYANREFSYLPFFV
jgi:hypothetical protein